ncbi:MAG TPA: four helix bundle protein [Longimicrobiales bacterium]|nr:four helix bundle protein [Longimicrobiales bacterium]
MHVSFTRGCTMGGFEFQRLRVFDAAADAAADVNGLARRIPVAHRALRDQVSRSSASVALNIAEGADEFRVAEKVRFYRMARRSAAETAGALTLLVRFGVFTPQETERAIKRLNQVAAMLTTMMTSVEGRGAPGPGPGPRAPARITSSNHP